MKNDVKEYDIEVFFNMFEVGIKDFRTKEVINLEISEEFDQRQEIYDFFSSYDGYLIGFNIISYDNLVIKYYLKEWSKLKKLPKKELLIKFKTFSDKAINSELNWEYLKNYKYFEVGWKVADLFCYWSKMLRISKKISLKSLAIQLNYEEIQELPYPHDSILTLEQIREVRRYNNINDLGITDLLAEKMREDIKLRLNIQKEYNLNCMSWDAPKIAAESLLQDYCNQTGKDIQEVKSLKFQPYTGFIGDLIKDVPFEFQNKQLQFIYEEILKSNRSFSKEFTFISGETRLNISLGIGGAHNIFENQIYKPKEGEIIISSDVSSMYPNIIINHNCCRFPELIERYKSIKIERIAAKKAKIKQKDAFFKIILNSFSGLIDNEHSPLYYPEGALKMRILGQLTILKGIDLCVSKGYKVIMVNTDSIDCIIKDSQEEEYTQLIDSFGKEQNLDFEHEKIIFTVAANINNYIQLSTTGKVKKKGLFKCREDIPLGDSVNELVVPKALENYFINNIPLEETIKNPEKYGLTIFDYCCSKKISHEYDVFYNGSKIQNLNRYYFSHPTPFLFKRKNSTAKKQKANADFEHLHVGESVVIYNKHEPKSWEEYNINYKHYIAKAREIVDLLELKQKQLSLF